MEFQDEPNAATVGAPAADDLDRYKEQLWRCAQQSLDQAILLLDPGHRVIWANPGALQIFGVAADEIAGMTIERFFTPEDADLGVHEQEIDIAASGSAATNDRWMRRGDGSRFWASGLMVAVRGGDGKGPVTGFVKLLRDHTNLKMQLEALRLRAVDASDSERRRGRAIAVMSHELRNPLSSLTSATTVLGRVAAGDTRLQEPLAIMQRSAGFIKRLLDDLDDATRVAEDKIELQPEPLLLRDMLQAAIDDACERAGRDPRDIALLLPASSITVEADRLRLQQVFMNLVGNAIKFTDAGDRIWVTGTAEGRQAVVRVADAGAGIAPEMLERIFGMFTQVETETPPAGLGVGLAVVKQLVERHGGSVQARSDGIGKGSEFTVRLPLRQDTPVRGKDAGVEK